MWGQGPWHAVRIEELGGLQATRGLQASLRPTLPDHRLVGHGGLVLEHSVPELRGAVVGHAGQPGDQGPRGEVGREVLIGEPVHGLHRGDRAAAVGRHAGPRVAADVLQAGHRLAGRRAGVHAGLPLRGLCPVGGAQALLLGVARAVERVLLAGRCLHVGLLVGMVRGGTFFICRDRRGETGEAGTEGRRGHRPQGSLSTSLPIPIRRGGTVMVEARSQHFDLSELGFISNTKRTIMVLFYRGGVWTEGWENTDGTLSPGLRSRKHPVSNNDYYLPSALA